MIYLICAILFSITTSYAADTATSTDTSSSTSTTSASPGASKSPLALQEELMQLAPMVEEYSVKDAPVLLWEDSSTPENIYWSHYAFSVINSVLDDLNHAKDIGSFCPKYKSLTRDQQIGVWGEIFSAIAYWESSFDPTNTTLETMGDKGTDAVTHLPLYSAGLLQLSYQDTVHYKEGSCPFDWNKDKDMDPKDLHRTLLNPYTNLYCGIHIMAEKITANRKIISSHQYYWSTLQRGNWVEDRKGQISRMVHEALPYCGGNKLIDETISHTIDPLFEFIRDHI